MSGENWEQEFEGKRFRPAFVGSAWSVLDSPPRRREYVMRSRNEALWLARDLNWFEEEKADYREVLEKISKMGRVCEGFDICQHPYCTDSAGACLLAMDALGRHPSATDLQSSTYANEQTDA